MVVKWNASKSRFISRNMLLTTQKESLDSEGMRMV